MRAAVVFLVLLSVNLPRASAQASASFRLAEHALNAGGNPRSGAVLSSPAFRLTLDALGEGSARLGLAGSSYRLDGGFVAPYPPPGEVFDLRFEDRDTLGWRAHSAAGTYDLYRDPLGALPGLGYGVCRESGLARPGAVDTGIPPSDTGYFYLATVENRIGEHGTKGFQSDGVTEREGTICP